MVCVKGVRIQGCSGLYFPAFGLNTERQEVSLRVQSECVKIRTRTKTNTDNFYAQNDKIIQIMALVKIQAKFSKYFQTTWFNKIVGFLFANLSNHELV